MPKARNQVPEDGSTKNHTHSTQPLGEVFRLQEFNLPKQQAGSRRLEGELLLLQTYEVVASTAFRSAWNLRRHTRMPQAKQMRASGRVRELIFRRFSIFGGCACSSIRPEIFSSPLVKDVPRSNTPRGESTSLSVSGARTPAHMPHATRSTS